MSYEPLEESVVQLSVAEYGEIDTLPCPQKKCAGFVRKEKMEWKALGELARGIVRGRRERLKVSSTPKPGMAVDYAVSIPAGTIGAGTDIWIALMSLDLDYSIDVCVCVCLCTRERSMQGLW